MEEISPRSYQLEVLKAALRENSLIFLPTGIIMLRSTLCNLIKLLHSSIFNRFRENLDICVTNPRAHNEVASS